MSTSPSLVILAAGIGSRYGGLKQIDPIGPSGEIVIDYSVYDAKRAGFSEVVFVIRREIEDAFKERIGSTIAGHLPCRYALQELSDAPDGFVAPEDRKKPWGTAHAIYSCREQVDRPFGVINADDFYGPDSFARLASLLSVGTESEYGLVPFVLKNTLSDHGSVSRAICGIHSGFLADIVERTEIEKVEDGARYREDGEWFPLTGQEPVSMNMWGFHPGFFAHLEEGFRRFLQESGDQPKSEFLIPTVTDHLIKSGKARVRTELSNESWLGVTYPEDKPAVQQGIRDLVANGVYPESLWS